jgi:hypothetical protein
MKCTWLQNLILATEIVNSYFKIRNERKYLLSGVHYYRSIALYKLTTEVYINLLFSHYNTFEIFRNRLASVS